MSFLKLLHLLDTILQCIMAAFMKLFSYALCKSTLRCSVGGVGGSGCCCCGGGVCCCCALFHPLLFLLLTPAMPAITVLKKENIVVHPLTAMYTLSLPCSLSPSLSLTHILSLSLSLSLSLTLSLSHSRLAIKAALEENERIITMTSFPRMGLSSFTTPSLTPGGPVTESLFVGDGVIFSHPRFATLTANIRKRRGENVCINVPLFVDENTLIASRVCGRERERERGREVVCV